VSPAPLTPARQRQDAEDEIRPSQLPRKSRGCRAADPLSSPRTLVERRAMKRVSLRGRRDLTRRGHSENWKDPRFARSIIRRGKSLSRMLDGPPQGCSESRVARIQESRRIEHPRMGTREYRREITTRLAHPGITARGTSFARCGITSGASQPAYFPAPKSHERPVA